MGSLNAVHRKEKETCYFLGGIHPIIVGSAKAGTFKWLETISILCSSEMFISFLALISPRLQCQ